MRVVGLLEPDLLLRRVGEVLEDCSASSVSSCMKGRLSASSITPQPTRTDQTRRLVRDPAIPGPERQVRSQSRSGFAA